MQEKKLVDLYLSSTLNVETINNKNDIIKKEIENLNKKKQQINPNNEYDNATITIYNELLKQNFYADGIINCPYIKNENIVDYLTLIPEIPSEIA